MQDRLNMANSNSFVLGEECSQSGEIRGGYFRWHKTLTKLAELFGVGPVIWQKAEAINRKWRDLFQQGQTLLQLPDFL